MTVHRSIFITALAVVFCQPVTANEIDFTVQNCSQHPTIELLVYHGRDDISLVPRKFYQIDKRKKITSNCLGQGTRKCQLVFKVMHETYGDAITIENRQYMQVKKLSYFGEMADWINAVKHGHLGAGNANDYDTFQLSGNERLHTTKRCPD